MKEVSLQLTTALLGLLFFLHTPLRADEGMWLPFLLGEGTEADMQRLGMKITAEDIYSLNNPSMKDAVVLFGGGCTGALVSEQGLLFTNHHCGYSAIQSKSTIEKDYLTMGFWAEKNEEELPIPGLKVSMVVSLEDVTERILEGIKNDMAADKRDAIVRMRIDDLLASLNLAKGTEAAVKTFYYGNQYILVISRVFRDVRLAGAPPSSIGKFGGDTDNWMWPRHTGDFAIFRVYADASNEPAEYNSANVPYRPQYVLPVSIKGVEENDFTFVYGFPGSTQEYLVSQAVDLIANKENPVSVQLRGTRLQIFSSYMQNDRRTRLQYAAKYANVENYYKKMKGESKGIQRSNVIEIKKRQEEAFQQWVNADEGRRSRYGNILKEIESLYSQITPYNLAFEYLFEGLIGIEAVKAASGYFKLVGQSKGKKKADAELSETLELHRKNINGAYRNYNIDIDRKVCASLLKIYYQGCEPKHQVPLILDLGKSCNGDFTNWVNKAYESSLLVDEERMKAFLKKYKPADYKILEEDPIFKLSYAVYDHYNNSIYPFISLLDKRIQEKYRIYLQGLFEMNSDKRFYPDANSTLRVSYGKVSGYKPADAVTYDYFTTYRGILQKEDTSIYDYRVSLKLKEAFEKGDFGRYAGKDGILRVCFVAGNHTTGGNSGSPVFNANGELVGLNFDRVWEGTMSDIYYDPSICRNLVLDVRYLLFVTELFSGSDRFTKELNLRQ